MSLIIRKCMYRCHWQRSNTWNATWSVKDPPSIEWKDMFSSQPCVGYSAPHLLTYVCKYKCTYASPTSPEPGDNHEHAGGLGDPGRAQKHQRAAEEGEDSSGGRLPEWRKGEVAVDPELVLQRSDTRTAGGAESVGSDLAASSANPARTVPPTLSPAPRTRPRAASFSQFTRQMSMSPRSDITQHTAVWGKSGERRWVHWWECFTVPEHWSLRLWVSGIRCPRFYVTVFCTGEWGVTEL